MNSIWTRIGRFLPLLTILYVGSARGGAAPALFVDDFESGDTTSWNAVYQNGTTIRFGIETSQHWSGNYSAKIDIAAPGSKLQMEGSFVSVPKLYLRAAFYMDPTLTMAPGEWITILGPANTSVGILDKISLKKRADGKFILSSQRTGDGQTVLAQGEWLTIESMYAPGDGTGEAAFWVNGELQRSRSDLVLTTGANSVMAGALEFSWNSTPSGAFYFDDVEVSTERSGPLVPKCTLYHPDLRGRSGAKIQTVLNGWKPGWHFSASLSGPALPTSLVYDVQSLTTGTFYFPLELSKLPRGRYTLAASVVDEAGVSRGTWSSEFEKNYDRDSRLTVDSNNNVILDGKPFIPVTPFGLPEEQISAWAQNGYINCLYGQNWWQPTTATMRNYAALGAKEGIPTFGPLNLADNHARNTALVTEHVLAARDNPNIVGYTYVDEPDYNGYPPEAVREWWQTSKQLDGSRLVHMNLMGSDFIGTGANLKIGKQWTYPNQFADIYGFDVYPLWKPNFTIPMLGDAADNLMKFNRGLIPFFAFVQTCNVEPTNSVSRAPTPDELRVMAWVLILHGAKGIQWYHYGSGTSPECFAAMAKFTSDIKNFTPVILSPLPAPTAECAEAKGPTAPLHLMVRSFAGKTYLFAANATNSAKAFRCSLAGTASGSRFGIAGREDVIVYGDTSFEDTLPPFEVRIYYSKKLSPPANLKALPK